MHPQPCAGYEAGRPAGLPIPALIRIGLPVPQQGFMTFWGIHFPDGTGTSLKRSASVQGLGPTADLDVGSLSS